MQKKSFLSLLFLVWLLTFLFFVPSCRLFDTACQSKQECQVGEICNPYSKYCEKLCNTSNDCYPWEFCDKNQLCTPLVFQPKEELLPEKTSEVEIPKQEEPIQEEPIQEEPIQEILDGSEPVLPEPKGTDWNWEPPACTSCDVGGLKCQGQEILECKQDADPCKMWQKSKTCASDEQCYRGQCVVNSLCQTKTSAWPFFLDCTMPDQIYDIAVDSKDNVYITGYFQGEMNVGGKRWVSRSIHDFFLIKFDNQGVFQFIKTFPSIITSEEKGWSIVFDKSGNLFVSISITGKVHINNKDYNIVGGDDVVIAKLDPNGTFLWSTLFGGTHTDFVYGMALDSKENLIVAGEYRGTFEAMDTQGKKIQFNSKGMGITKDPSLGTRDIFIGKMDTQTGAFLWVKVFGTTFVDKISSVAVDSKDQIWAVGRFGENYNGDFFNETTLVGTDTQTIEFITGQPIVSKGDSDGFVLRLQNDGQIDKVLTFGSSQQDAAFSVVVNSKDEVFVGGLVGTGVEFSNAPSQASSVSPSNLLMKLDNDAKILWVQYTAGGCNLGGFDSKHDIQLDSTGNVYSIGCFGGTLKVDSLEIKAKTAQDMYVMKSDDLGKAGWITSFGVFGYLYPSNLAVDSQNNVYFSAGFHQASSLQLKQTLLKATGNADAFLVKIDPKGNTLLVCE